MTEGHRAVSILYQGLLTGLVLTLVTRRGEDDAAEFVFRLFRRQHAARLIGMQYYDETARLLGIIGSGPATFARYFAALAAAQGDEVEVTTGAGQARVRQKGWRLARGPAPLDPAAFDAWSELWHGALAAFDRRLRLTVTREAGAVEFVITSR